MINENLLFEPKYPLERPLMVHILTGDTGILRLLQLFDGSKDSGVQKSQTTNRIHIHYHIITSVFEYTICITQIINYLLPTVEKSVGHLKN